MGFDDGAADREADPHPIRLSREERVEKGWQNLWCNSRTLIFYTDLGIAAVDREFDFDLF